MDLATTRLIHESQVSSKIFYLEMTPSMGKTIWLPFDSHLGVHLMGWRLKALKFFFIGQRFSTFESLHNRRSPIHHDGNDFEGEHVMLVNDLGQRPSEIEFTLGQTFFERTFLWCTQGVCNHEKFEVKHIRTNSRTIDKMSIWKVHVACVRFYC